MSTIIWLAYGLVAIASIRPIAGHLAWDLMDRGNEKEAKRYGRSSKDIAEKPTWDQWFGCTMMALGVAGLWPVVLAVFVLGRVRVGKEREYVPKLKAQEREKLAKRLDDLEQRVLTK